MADMCYDPGDPWRFCGSGKRGFMNDDRRYCTRLSDKQLLQLFDSYDTYVLEICDEICIRAGLEDEWLASDGDTFEGVVDRAYEILKEDLDEETN